MSLPKGLTTTAGVSIIAIAIVVVGVVIYFVYSETKPPTSALTIQIESTVNIEEGTSKTVTGVVTSSDTISNILLSVSQSNAVVTQLSSATCFSGDEFTLTLLGKFFSDEIVTLTATQGESTITFPLSVKVFSTSTNTNTANNVNSVSNTNVTNTNTDTQAGTFVDGPLNITMEYPVEWGNSFTPELNMLKPVDGNIRLAYFENLNRIDVPGRVYISGATSNYIPEQSAGTIFWFPAKISASSSLSTIEEQIVTAGFTPLKIEKVTIGGRDAVRMINYRGYYHHYLDITYLLPYDAREDYDTLFIARSLAIITEDSEVPFYQLLEEAKVLATKIEERTAPDDVLLRFDQFEDAIATLRFIQ